MNEAVETAPTEGMEPSIDDTLDEVFDSIEAEDSEQEETQEPVKEQPEAGTPEQDDEQVEEKEETEQPESEPVQEGGTKPPASWTKEAKEKFLAADPVIQQQVLKRESDIQKGMEKNAELAKQATSMNEVIAPYRALIASEGGTPEGAIQDLLNTAYIFRQGTPQQKTQALTQIATQFGVDIGPLQNNSEQGEDAFDDPAIADLKNEITQLKSQLQNREQSEVVSRQTEAQKVITDFSGAKDDKGNLKHPHFEALKQDMSKLISSGMAPSLEEAYEIATYSNKEIRSLILEAEKKAFDAKRVEDEKVKVAEAKRAMGKTLSGKGSYAKANDEATGSIDDTLDAVLDDIEKRG